MASAVSRSRVLSLMKTQCRIFDSTYNPERLRLGNKYLKRRLRGPAVASYYPARIGTVPQLRRSAREAGEKWTIDDEDELDRLDIIARLKARGKGAPTKKKGPPEKKGKR